MNHPLVSIITVNYKQPKVTCELLRSINQLSYPNLEVIVVDNEQSKDNSTEFKKYHPETKVINCVENLGFAGGNNCGIKASNGEFLFFVNNDTVLCEHNIQTLILALGDKKIGAMSPIIRHFDMPEKIQFAGFTKLNPYTGRNRTIRKASKNYGGESTPYIHGAAVMVRREVIDKCGLMPEDYFLYYEEFAWSENIKSKGYQLRVNYDTAVLHKESISTKKNSPLKIYYQTRNRIAFMNRYSTPFQRLIFKMFFLTISLPFNIFRFKIRKEKKHLAAFYKALHNGFFKKKMGMNF